MGAAANHRRAVGNQNPNGIPWPYSRARALATCPGNMVTHAMLKTGLLSWDPSLKQGTHSTTR
jgi:hypothetical protein